MSSLEVGVGLAGTADFGPVASTVSVSVDVTRSGSLSSKQTKMIAGTTFTVQVYSTRIDIRGNGAVCEAKTGDKGVVDRVCVTDTVSVFDVTEELADAVLALPAQPIKENGPVPSAYLAFLDRFGDVVTHAIQEGGRQVVSTDATTDSSSATSKASFAVQVAGTRKFLDQMSVPSGVKTTTTYTKSDRNAIGQTVDTELEQVYDTRPGTAGHGKDKQVDIIGAVSEAKPKVQVNLGYSRSTEQSKEAAMMAAQNKLVYIGGDTRKLAPSEGGASDRTEWLKSIEEHPAPIKQETKSIESVMALRGPCLAGERAKGLAGENL